MEKLPQLTDEEFEHIEEVIARSAKGRAFLRRYFRRAMGAATSEIRSMLEEMRSGWNQQSNAVQAASQVDVIRRELVAIASSIEQARKDVASVRAPDVTSSKIELATNELDAIVISTERASFDILNSAERLQDSVNKLKEQGADRELCNAMEMEITTIFTACSFQDLTGQRTRKVVDVLRYIEQRVNAMIGIWGSDGAVHLPSLTTTNEDTRPDAHLLSGPQLDGVGVSQDDIDKLLSGDDSWSGSEESEDDEPAETEDDTTPLGGPQSQADIDAMFDAPAPRPTASAASQPHSQAEIDALFGASAAASPTEPQSQADIDAMFDAPAPKPAAPKKQQSQADIDAMFDAPAPKPAAPKKQQSQADIDAMFDAPAPKPAAPKKQQSQADIDAMFDAPAPKPAAPKSAESSQKAVPAKPPAKAAGGSSKAAQPQQKAPPPAKPKTKPTKAEEPEQPASEPLDQSAIDALFG